MLNDPYKLQMVAINRARNVQRLPITAKHSSSDADRLGKVTRLEKNSITCSVPWSEVCVSIAPMPSAEPSVYTVHGLSLLNMPIVGLEVSICFSLCMAVFCSVAMMNGAFLRISLVRGRAIRVKFGTKRRNH